MKKLKDRISSPSLINVLTLFTGASVSQLIPIIIAPVLARIYAPAQFGDLGVIASVAGVFSIIATFQYESAIVLPKKDEDAFNLLSLSIILTFLVATTAFLITQLFGQQIGMWLNAPTFVKWSFVVPLMVLLDGLFNSLNMWATRLKEFKRLALRRVAQTGVSASTKLILGWMKHLNSGLIWGSLSGQVTSTGMLAILTVKDSRQLFSTITKDKIKENALRYRDFPKYTMWQGFFDMANASGIIFVLSNFYGVSVVGFYAFTIGLLQKPTQMIGNAVAQVFYQSASEKAGQGKSIYSDTLRLLKNLVLVGAVIYIPILIAGPYLFSFVFGSTWFEAGALAQIISFWFFLRFITSPMANIMMILEKQRQFFVATIILNLIPPSFIALGGMLGHGYLLSFTIVSASMFIYLSVIVIWILRLTKFHNAQQ